MNALVTGAAGFIGSHLAEALLDRGALVTGIDCFTDSYSRALKESNLSSLKHRRGFHLIQASVAGTDLRALLTGKTHVFHLAAQAGVRRSWGGDFHVYTVNNVDATQILLEACAGQPLEKVVYASSSSVYGDHVPMPMREDMRPQPLSPYGVTKLAGEHLCRLYCENHGVPTVSLRYFTVYGPRQRPDMGFHRFLRAISSGEPVTVYGDGEQTRDFTFVADAVAATVAAGERGSAGDVYNIGGGSRVTINHTLELCGRVTGKPVVVRREPEQKGDVRHTYADTSRARAAIGFNPLTSLEDGLAAEHRWLSSVGSLASS